MMNLGEGNIVVPLDGSTNSEAAVRVGLRLGEVYGAHVEFVHVVDDESREVDTPKEQLQDRFDGYVQGVVGDAGGAGSDWSSRLEFGPAAQTILEVAKGARLVVMATHGEGGFHAAFIGSVTDKVVRSSEVPVLTVPVGEQSSLAGGPVLVGLDGSETAEQVLPVARDLASRLGLGVVLLQAYMLPPTAGYAFSGYSGETVDLLLEAANEYLGSVAQPGEQTVTAMASAAMAITDTANELGAAVVVLAPHGKGFIHRLALGSTTDRVIHSLQRPVLVVPTKD